MCDGANLRTISPSIIGFKPRQVALAEKNSTLMGKNTAELKDDSTLTCSVALWLQTKGFSKLLKRFLSSAQIQDEDWKSKALDLNEVFVKHLAASNDVNEKASPQEEKKELLVVDSAQVDGGNTESKKKKKKNKGEDVVTENGKATEEVVKNEKVKKSKTDAKQDKKDETSDAVEKKASKKRSIDATEGDDESKKAFKKRKRMAADETEDQPNEEVVQELKTKKSKGAKEGKDATKDDEKNKEESSAEDVTVVSKDDVKNEVETFSNSKSGRKQNGNSSEPKIAFQRVKIDEVKFAHDKLQDNSYWAKGGADVGYGAKAQDVLGQVRGRDFRHEKTKKKRGSYRGGQIDLESHSIKFANSDDE